MGLHWCGRYRASGVLEASRFAALLGTFPAPGGVTQEGTRASLYQNKHNHLMNPNHAPAGVAHERARASLITPLGYMRLMAPLSVSPLSLSLLKSTQDAVHLHVPSLPLPPSDCMYLE